MAEADQICVRYRVTGRVQGVGFRYFVWRRAQDLGLGGWVRNLPDGAVEVEAVGREADLAALEGDLEAGPPGSRVDRVEGERRPPPEERKGFEVRFR